MQACLDEVIGLLQYEKQTFIKNKIKASWDGKVSAVTNLPLLKKIKIGRGVNQKWVCRKSFRLTYQVSHATLTNYIKAIMNEASTSISSTSGSTIFNTSKIEDKLSKEAASKMILEASNNIIIENLMSILFS